MLDSGLRVLFMGNNFLRLLEGLWVTIEISMISLGFSLLFGIVLGILMTLRNPVVRCTTKIYLEFIRIMPQLVLLFLVYFGSAKTFGLQFSGRASAIIVFTMWGTAEMGDLVRGALVSIPAHQYRSGEALGLGRLQIYYYIIIPQTIRQLIPLAINLMTRMIKTTSLIVLIGVVEVMKTAQQIIEANRYTVPDSALWIYGFIFFLYFIVCWPFSRLAVTLEKKFVE